MMDGEASWRRGRYRILGPIGEGGQAATLLAEDRVTSRRVVLKHAPPRDEAVAREFRRLVGLDHPHVVEVFDLYREPRSGSWVMVEEFIEGAPLSRRLGRLTAKEWRRVAVDLIAAVAHLRAAETRHGDIKPDNVLVRGRGASIEAILVDFGFAAPLRSPGIPGGTPSYFAPEMLAGEGSPAADIWALGLSLAQALTGSDLPARGFDLDDVRVREPWLARLLLDEPQDRLRSFESLVDEVAASALPRRLPFVGREAERRELARAHLVAAEGGREAVVDCPAAPGRGAGRLIETVIADLRREDRPALFRGDWFDLELLVREALVEIGDDFDSPLPDDSGPESLVATLWAAADRRKTTLLIGLGRAAADLPGGRALIALAARQTADAVRLVVFRAREPQAGESGLPALGRDEVQRLMRRLLSVVARAEPERVGRFADLILELSGGQPALIDSLVRGAIERDVVALDGGSLRIDESALRTLEIEVDGLPADPDVMSVARALSANLGRLDRDALSELCELPIDRLEHAVARLRRGGLLRDPGGIARPLVYLGPALEGPMWPVSAPRQAPVADVAIRIEPWLDSPSPDAAARHLDRALDGRRGAEVAKLLFLLVRALAAAGDRRRALELLEDLSDAERAALSPRDLALFAATMQGALGRRAQALEAVERGLEAVAEDDDRAILLAEAAFLRLLEGDSTAALALADEALALARQSESRARAATMAATAGRQAGDLDAALERFEIAERIFGELGDRRRQAALLANRAMVDLDRGRPAAAATTLEEARRALAEVGSVDQYAAASLNLGVARQSLRDFPAARRALAEAERLFSLIGDQQRAAAAHAARGIALVDGGEARSGARLLAEAARTFAAIGDEANLPLEHRLRLERARADLLSGAPGRAARRLRRIDEELLDPPSRARLETLRSVFSAGAPFSGDPPRPAKVAAWLRSRDIVARGCGLAHAIVRHRDLGRLDLARRQLRRLFALLEFLENDMSEPRKGLHRAGVALPLLEALRDRLEIGLVEEGGAVLAGVHEAMIAVNEAADLAEALEAIAAGVIGLGRALRVYVVGWDGSRAEVLAEARRDERGAGAAEISTLVLRRVAATDEAVVVADAGADDLFGFAGSVRALGLRSVACFPLLADGARRIMLYLDTPLASGAFDQAHLRAVETFATIAKTACSLHHRALTGEAIGRQARRETESVRLELKSRSVELDRLRESVRFGRIVGESRAIKEVVAMIGKVAPTDLSVLITGETGCGKELVAQAIHAASLRGEGPFVAINCANINPLLAESELFGHRKGAFTGATGNRDGLFLAAGGGTVFLDEVGELAPELQAKLLRVLESRELRPVGSEETVPVDVRIVAATNADVRDRDGFRQDLYFRLAQVEFVVPPLRERREDIPLLVRHLLEERDRRDLTFEKEAMEALCDYDWPGNVRELRNVVERSLLLAAGDRVLLPDLPEAIWQHRGRKPLSLAEMEAQAIRDALRYTGGEKKAAAELLGISRTAIYEKLRRLGPDFA